MVRRSGEQAKSSKSSTSPVVGGNEIAAGTKKKRGKIKTFDPYFGLRIYVKPKDKEAFLAAAHSLWEKEEKWTSKRWKTALYTEARKNFGLEPWGGSHKKTSQDNTSADQISPVAGHGMSPVAHPLAEDAAGMSASKDLTSLVTDRAISLKHCESTCTAVYDSSGAAALMKAKHASGLLVPFTPQPVVDWLYQVLGMTLSLIQKLLGTKATFDANGCFVDKERGDQASGGMLATFWGTEIGVRRDQALVAWDYDVDLAAFITSDCDFDRVWRQAAEKMEPFGLRMINHRAKSKYRITPTRALAFNAWKERYQQTVLDNPGKGRPEIIRLASLSKKRHEPILSPSGCNCLDLEIYVVKPRSKLGIEGSSTIHKVPCSAIFPIAEGIFGPLRVPVPATSKILDLEYGQEWRHKQVVKAIQKSGRCIEVDVSGLNARRCAWPAMPLHSCSELIGGFYGVALDAASDTQWRYEADFPQNTTTFWCV